MTVINAWSGGLTPSGFTVVAKVTGSSCRLAVADNAGIVGPVYFGPVTPTNSVVRFTATGLAADTQCYWAIEEDSVLQTAMAGKSHTVGAAGEPYSFTFAASACAGGAGNTNYPVSGALLPHYVSNHPCFDDIRAQNPLFVMHSGDIHYGNVTRTGDAPTDGGSWPSNNIDSWRRLYDDLLLGRQGTLYRNVPLQYVWDNHDSAQPTSDDGSSNRHAAGMVNAAAVYRERVPSYTLPAADGQGIYHSFEIGRVLFIASDTRTYRDSPTDDPAPRTYLGSDQLAWMESVLSTSDAKYLVWQQTQDWTASNNVDGQSWGMYSEERANLVQMFGDYGWLNRMCSIFGDTHAMAMDSGTGANADLGGFPLFLFCSLDSDQNAGPNYDLGRRGSTTGGVRGQWGTVQVTDTGARIQVKANGWWWSA
jgi:phosphodiesterase/alkaline phosphatase D-like protein